MFSLLSCALSSAGVSSSTNVANTKKEERNQEESKKKKHAHARVRGNILTCIVPEVMDRSIVERVFFAIKLIITTSPIQNYTKAQMNARAHIRRERHRNTNNRSQTRNGGLPEATAKERSKMLYSFKRAAEY